MSLTRRTAWLARLGLGVLLGLGTTLSATSRVPTKPLKERVNTAEHVFVGTLIDRTEQGDWVQANLRVDVALKGAKAGDTVPVTWRRMLGNTEIYNAEAGARGIAILGDKHQGRYWLRADKFEPTDKLAEVRKIIDPTGKHAKPLKVYILAGQSNMEGHAHVSTFDYIGADPKTAGLLKRMRDDDGRPTVCDDVWISYHTGQRNPGEGFGKLTAGYGARPDPARSNNKIGPEYLFGITMDTAHDGPVLIIKTAWGGKSLHTDFRPPSAGRYELAEKTQALWDKHPGGAHGIPSEADRPKWRAEKDKQTGVYYRMMVEHVRKVLADPARVCPAYDPRGGYEIAGFVWFQGWNDMVDRQTYPDSAQPDGYAEYTRLMSHFIRDVRKEFKAPDMPFVIGVIGVGGEKATGGIANLARAMKATAELPEFKGNVAAVPTAPFWDEQMAALEGKKRAVQARLGAAYQITEQGVMETPDPALAPTWQPLGTPAPAARTWRYTSFDPQNEQDKRPAIEKRRFRDVALPDGMEGWHKPGFDDSDWNRGKAPIGKGVWKHRAAGNATVKFNSEWGDGEFLIARTTFHVDRLDAAQYRISVLAKQCFRIYLNGEQIHQYIWWRDDPVYRPIVLGENHAQHLKQGDNVLAIWTSADLDRRTGAQASSVDVFIESITEQGLANVQSEAYRRTLLDKIATRREQTVIAGMSNGGYHYLGSAKIMAQIGKAFADAMLELEESKPNDR